LDDFALIVKKSAGSIDTLGIEEQDMTLAAAILVIVMVGRRRIVGIEASVRKRRVWSGETLGLERQVAYDCRRRGRDRGVDG
jgi:hypothetical protein